MSQSITHRVHDAVVLYPTRELPEHEAFIHRDIAARIADLLDVPFEGSYDPARHDGMACYYIPSDTLIGVQLKETLKLTDQDDLFGGYADYEFMPTKAVTHGLIAHHAAHPAGWNEQFAELVKDAVLPGYTAFSVDDIRKAARRLLLDTPIRIKPVNATAGRGQILIKSLDELEKALSTLEPHRLADCGIVVEAHLNDVTTYSVGQVRVAGVVASYIGTQHLTPDNRGEQVYGGSTLQFTRGGYDSLAHLPLTADCRMAIELAKQYDRAASACYPGFFASRRNYDVAAGTDAHGSRTMGVLEQSWRIGGASRAEIAALEVLAADPSCMQLCASTVEVFGPTQNLPAHAVETYSGIDPDLGQIRKYVMVEAYGNIERDHRNYC